VEEDLIVYVGPKKNFPASVTTRTLAGTTLMPGMIEGHSHILLHPYNETGWTEQVLNESHAERTARAVNHLKANLMAGFTTLRDLGSEGAGYTDVGLRTAIEKGVIPGPRLLVAGPAIVVTGSYGPKGFHEGVHVPLGAEEADGHDDLIKTVRRQIGHGVDYIKVYADYRWGPDNSAMPTFSLEELLLIVQTAEASGRVVVAHAATAEGMRRAALAGVSTIEHGDGGNSLVFSLMKSKGVALCPTIAAGEAIERYRGWNKNDSKNTPARITNKRQSVSLALQAGVDIVAGGDVGVFPHGENAVELELMEEYGFSRDFILKSVTSGNARLLNLAQLGELKSGYLADIIAVEGDPLQDLSSLKKVVFVMKDGVVYKTN
ncbi:MAG: amidohydrolase family protein, partial [Bacteroidota bacterium]